MYTYTSSVRLSYSMLSYRIQLLTDSQYEVVADFLLLCSCKLSDSAQMRSRAFCDLSYRCILYGLMQTMIKRSTYIVNSHEFKESTNLNYSAKLAKIAVLKKSPSDVRATACDSNQICKSSITSQKKSPQFVYSQHLASAVFHFSLSYFFTK